MIFSINFIENPPSKATPKINRLYSLIESGELSIRTDTLKRLITKVLTGFQYSFPRRTRYRNASYGSTGNT